ncbi:2-oxo acid dehydrogenase subunit E2 [Candidatus Poribacteria bacterium]|nr:2-oxo acid dehydrogenase subunit E2 [Candidatus Poribacteria bacterium]
MTPIVLPKSGFSSEASTVIGWSVAEGDRVEEGQLLCEVETEKTTIEITAPASGLLRKILIHEGEKRPVGVTMGFIGEADEPIPEVEEVPLPTPEATQVSTAPSPSTRPRRATTGRVRASPAARKLAAEHGIDLAELSGSGPGGAITTGDVEHAVEASRAASDAELVPMSSMRRAIARMTQESFQSAPHFYLTLEADAASLLNDRPEGISITHCFVKAVGLALREFPQMRAQVEGDAFAIPHAVNVGLITAVEDGLVVPVIRDADQRPLAEIAETVRSLVDGARSGKLSADDASGAGFSITNLGMYDIETFHAIIHAPEAAILAVGTIVEKPVVKDGQVVPGVRMALTLSCDHRVVDGVIAAQFLGRLKQLVEDISALE